MRTIKMFSLLDDKNYYWGKKGHLNPTATAEKAENKCLLKVFHAYGTHTSRQKSKFWAFITEVASANKVLMGKSG